MLIVERFVVSNYVICARGVFWNPIAPCSDAGTGKGELALAVR
jgi:hypothetical protein